MQIRNLSIDAAEIPRLATLLKGARRESTLRRLLSPREQSTLKKLRAHSQREAEWLAGRFAAKEAVIKLLKGPGGFGGRFTEIEILADRSGAPRVHLVGQAQALANGLGIQRILISLSHTRTTAVAMAASLSAKTPAAKTQRPSGSKSN